MRRRFAYSLLPLFALALIVACLTRRAPLIAQDQPAAKPPAATVAKRQLQGTPSCSASICHGGNDIQKRFSETITWQALDPHARAYDTLLTAQAQGIAKRLWNDQTPAHDAPLCLKCHVHPDYENARPNFRKQDGVGCESCHGAAQDWLKPHYRAGWQQTDRARLGFADTKHLRGRAEICVTCHVGTPDANVDHDLIAAGHPALRFEFATYFANLPAHWDVARDKKENSTPGAKYVDFEMRAWSLGQHAALAQSMDLLAHRAAHGKAWPEFADLDCFSCHHDLQPASWRQKKESLQNRRPGSLVWNEWYAPFAPGLFARLGFFEKPGRADIATNASVLAQVCRAWNRRALPFGLEFPDNGLPRLANEDKRPPLRNWNEATQYYLLLLAARQMRKDNEPKSDADLERRSAELRGQVTFAPGYDSPRGFVKKK